MRSKKMTTKINFEIMTEKIKSLQDEILKNNTKENAIKNIEKIAIIKQVHSSMETYKKKQIKEFEAPFKEISKLIKEFTKEVEPKILIEENLGTNNDAWPKGYLKFIEGTSAYIETKKIPSEIDKEALIKLVLQNKDKFEEVIGKIPYTEETIEKIEFPKTENKYQIQGKNIVKKLNNFLTTKKEIIEGGE